MLFSSYKKRLSSVSRQGVCSFRIEIDETSCFYFCDHFYKAFKRKVKVKSASVLKQKLSGGVIGYCADCRKKICNYLLDINTLSDDFLNKARKLLIQYFHMFYASEKSLL